MDSNEEDSMVLSRSKRNNAGARMAQLLDSEDCDDFYQSTYGGFFDEEGDDAYESPVESESDYVDSDFDIDETEQTNVKAEEDDDEDYDEGMDTKKKKGKVYKEPTFRQPAAAKATPDDARKPKSTGVEKTKRERSSYRPLSPPPEKQFRASTVQKSELYERLREEKQEKRRRRKKNKRPSEYYQKPSQEEVLKEAKETEEENLKSLERFQQYELEKRKRHRFRKQRLIKGPFVRYLSLTMPATGADPSISSNAKNSTIDSQTESDTSAIDSESNPVRKFYVGDDQSEGSEQNSNQATAQFEKSENVTCESQRDTDKGNIGKCARTFVEFSDDATFWRCVPDSRKQPRPTIPQQQYCVVTALPAKYIDPLTKLPYSNTEAFKIIRQSYYKHVEEKGDRNDPAVSGWLESAGVGSRVSAM